MTEILLVLDYQNFIVNKLKNNCSVENIRKLKKLFKENNSEIIYIQHLSEDIKEEHDVNIAEDTEGYKIFTKTTPNAFDNSNLLNYIKEKKATRLIIVGYSTEYCCLFTSIVGKYLGFNVTLIEDACDTTADEHTYDMPGLNINDFIGSVLNWSEYVEVLYYEEYIATAKTI